MNETTPTSKRKQPTILPPLEVLDKLFTLDPETGIVRRRNHTWRHRGDGTAGTMNSSGYLFLKIVKVRYPVHRIVWKMHFKEEPPEMLDHANGVRHDNRPCNLREATGADNCANRQQLRNNTSGAKGVCWHKRMNQWYVRCARHGKSIYVGAFDDFDEACAAAIAARENHHGEFVNHGTHMELSSRIKRPIQPSAP